MRQLLGLIACVSLAAADVSQLRKIEDADRFFELRRALEQRGWNDAETLFYRAALNSRFGNEPQAVDELRTFLAAPSDSRMRRTAYEELASALVRMGRYREAADAWKEALGLTPSGDRARDDNENRRALYESLGDVPPQTIDVEEATLIQATQSVFGTWDVPVEVNGTESKWIFDTGANFSTLAESEAIKMGLSIRQATAYVEGSTGKKNPLRLAVAGDLRLGGTHVRNVVFLVLRDDALFVGPLKYQIGGILGMPVIRALGRVSMSAKGELRIEEKSPTAAQGEANLFFSEWDPIVEARHGGHRVQLFLDTGANKTSAYFLFRRALEKGEMAGLKKKSEKIGGAGGIVQRTTEVIPVLRLDVLGRTIDVPNVSLDRKQPAKNARYRDGMLGIDGLKSGFTLDFRAMQLIVN